MAGVRSFITELKGIPLGSKCTVRLAALWSTFQRVLIGFQFQSPVSIESHLVYNTLLHQMDSKMRPSNQI